jgi:digeranylgeranylglycerophospholipid reductase
MVEPAHSSATDIQLSSGQCFDIVIIGAGPAGLSAGLHAVRGGRRPAILLIDKIIPWERPKPCAEAVGRLGLEEAIEVKPSWIRQTIKSAGFHSPDNTTVTYTDETGGYIIDRAALQRDCTRELMNNGVTCLFNRRVNRLIRQEDSFSRAVEFDDGVRITGRVIIDASGPVSCFGRDEPLGWKPADLEPAYFVHAEGYDLPADTVHMYTGRDLAPGGYAWAFPRGNGSANIGVLIGSRFRGSVNIRHLLDAFLARHFPGITIVQRFAGSIPCGCRPGTTAVAGLIKTGDAASTVNPISRSGICEALLSGGLAGDYALLMLKAEREKEVRHVAASYESAWRKIRGNRFEKLSRAKNSLVEVPDDDYNRAARALARIPQEKLTMSRIFTTALSRFPRLAWSLRHLM